MTTDTIEWRVKPLVSAGILAADAGWTDYCRIITGEKTMQGTGTIIVEALNQMKDSTPPKMEYRLKPRKKNA